LSCFFFYCCCYWRATLVSAAGVATAACLADAFQWMLLLTELLLKLQLLFYLLVSADVATATADAVAATGGSMCLG
jgi:hypothetical protein